MSKKQSNMKLKLVYDTISKPDGMDMATMTKMYDQYNVVFWDSSKGGIKPRLFAAEKELTPAIVDTAGMEMDLEEYSKKFKEEEFWTKEIYKCKKSPMYFWSNYGTSVWPHTDKGMSKYLKELGLDNITSNDAEEAKKLWEGQRAKIQAATESYTIEFLQERKGIIDVVKDAYNQKVADLELKLNSHVRLMDSNNKPMEPKKQLKNLVEKIRKNLPVHITYSEKYRTNKGKWDTPLLSVTDYSILLKIYYDILDDRGTWEEVLDSPTD